MLTTRMRPKMSVSPLASRKRRAPKEIPFSPCWRKNWRVIALP